MADIVDLMKKALIVDEPDEDFNPLATPTNGQQYLQRVVHEAAQCDDVVVAEVDKTRLNRQTVYANNIPGCTEAPPKYAPSKEWQQSQVAEFSYTRLRLDKLRKESGNHPPPVKLPHHDNLRGWYKLCFGRDLEMDDSEVIVDVPKVKPLLSIVTKMPHSLVEKMLEYEIDWLTENGSSFTHDDGCWLYALLAALDVPLTPDICHLLRTLARTCSHLRATSKSPDDPHIPAFNLLICLVARYFRQCDLAD